MGLAGFALVFAAVSSPAQEAEPRTPRLRLPETPSPGPIQTFPRDMTLEYDPRLGIVGPARPFELEGERRAVVTGWNVRTWLEKEYLTRRSKMWSLSVVDRLAGRTPEEDQLIPRLEDPLNIPEPLEKIFGEGSDFDVQGKLRLGAVGSRSTQEPDLRPELLQRAIGGFDFSLDQILDLQILGTVGTKLDMAVDFNSERELESKQLITAAYTGTEDEILQRVEVGDIDVRLPPSRFLGSSVARGTFGAQALAQLGPVEVQFMGSRKEGETSTRSLSIAPRGEGVLQEVTIEIKDTQFQEDRFFLLFHPDSLAPGRIRFPNAGTSLADPANRPAEATLNVWLDDGNVTNNAELASKRGVAFVDPNAPGAVADTARQGFFDLLIEGEDYVVTDGIILQMRRQLNNDEMLAVSFETAGGTTVGSPQDAQELDLKLIKPFNPDTLDATWDLTMRNVYSLREPDIQLGSLGLEIFRGNRELKQTFETIGGESRKYSEIFGVTDDQSRVNAPRVLRDPFGSSDYLVLPNLRPFFEPTDEAGNPIPIERPNRALYFDDDTRQTALDNQIYFIEATYVSRGGITGEVELGASNIIEGSETVSIGGEPLVRGEDYQIFYDFGRVVFNDPAALAEDHPGESVGISFEVAPLFNLAPTSVWGMAGTWSVAPGLTINSSTVFQDKESLANRPILGAEPTRTLISEIDGTWNRDLGGLSRWLDGLPGIGGDERSRFSLRGEVAFSQPDPNTEGVVFLNDFESIEVAKRLSMDFRAWSLSSIPAQSEFDLLSATKMRWFTFAIDTRSVTPGARGLDRGENNLIVRLEPEGETPAERRERWRSIQTVISPNGEDLTRQEFIEFFVKADRGTIVVDLGTMDEDRVILDANGAPFGVGALNTEEVDPNTRDNTLDTSEDVGIDGVAGNDFAGAPEDLGNDDFDDSFDAQFPANPNGTEGNTVLDTEDVDFNGILDRRDDALRWVIDLSDTRFEVPGSRSRNNFRQIRLPLTAPDEMVGSPDLRNVRVLRMAFTGVETTQEFELVRMEIVGSNWLKRGIVDADGNTVAGRDSDRLRIAAINDVENPDYRSPPGVIAETARADEIAGLSGVAIEQSLELQYRDLPVGGRGTIFQSLFDRETYIDYDQMQVWVQGRSTDTGEQPTFFVSFGLDTLNVYEYAAPLRNEEWEEHVIDFGVFTELKRALLDSLAETDATTGVRTSEDGRFRVRIQTPDAPAPSITDVSQLTIGIENDSEVPVSGSFWINEWRLTGPVRDGGTAQFVDARAEIADFADVSFSFEGRGARYRNLSATRNNFDTSFSSFRALVRLEKTLPQSWGLSVPVTIDHRGNRRLPLFRTGSDIEVEGTEEDEQERTNDNTSFTIRAFRARNSSNPLIAATLDRLEARVSYFNDTSGSFDLDTDRSRWETFLGYSHAFRERGLPLGLGWIADLPWPEAIRKSEGMQKLVTARFNPVPASVRASTQTTFEEREVLKRFAGGDDFTVDSIQTMRTRTAFVLQPFRSMRSSFTWTDTRDFNFPETVVERGTFGVGALRTQNFDFNWTPPISSWLTPRYSYSSAFNRNHTRETSRAVDSLDLRDFSVSTTQGWTVELGVGELIDAIAEPGAGPRPWWRNVWEPIRFDRRTQENALFTQEEDDPGTGFSFGFGDLEEEASAEPQSLGDAVSWGISTGIQPVSGMSLRSAYRETDTRRAFFQGFNETFSRTWPDVSFRWTNVRVPGPLSSVVRTASITSDFERRINDSASNGQPLNGQERELWDPLLSLTLTWWNGMTTDLRANRSRNETSTIRGGTLDSTREEESIDVIFNLNYVVRPGTKLYIPWPTLWGVVLQQPLRASVQFARRGRDDVTSLEGQEEKVVNLESTTTEIRPSVSYEFGRVVSGFSFTYLSRSDEKRDIVNRTFTMEAFLDLLF